MVHDCLEDGDVEQLLLSGGGGALEDNGGDVESPRDVMAG